MLRRKDKKFIPRDEWKKIKKMLKKANGIFSIAIEQIVDAIKECQKCQISHAQKINPLLEGFFKHFTNEKINWYIPKEEVVYSTDPHYHLQEIARILYLSLKGIHYYTELSDKDITFFEKLLKELDALCTEIIYSSDKPNKEILKKSDCINDIIVSNTMFKESEKKIIFRNYENLWKVVHRINTEWEDLRNRGYLYGTYFHFSQAFDSEAGRDGFETFMEVLDGKIAFIPVYIPTRFRMVDSNCICETEIFCEPNEEGTIYNESYHLCQK